MVPSEPISLTGAELCGAYASTGLVLALVLSHDFPNGVGDLCTVGDPLLDPLRPQIQSTDLVPRIVRTENLEKSAVPGASRICGNHSVNRFLLGSVPSQP